MIQPEVKPEVKAYFRLDYDKDSKKTPKYTITKAWGDYPPIEELKGARSRKVSMYLMEKREGQPGNTPKLRLQAAKSLNFTGFKKV